MHSTINRAGLLGMLIAVAACGGEQPPTEDSALQDSAPDASQQAAPDTSQQSAPANAQSGEEETFEVALAGSGDDDGSGTASLTLNPNSGEVCYEIAVENIEQPTAAHIHEGTAGATGSVVVPFEGPPEQGGWQACVTGDPAAVAEIVQNPSGYYVNVHNEPFPAGAVRGQVGGG